MYLASTSAFHPVGDSGAINQVVLLFAFVLQIYFFLLFIPSFLMPGSFIKQEKAFP